MKNIVIIYSSVLKGRRGGQAFREKREWDSQPQSRGEFLVGMLLRERKKHWQRVGVTTTLSLTPPSS